MNKTPTDGVARRILAADDSSQDVLLLQEAFEVSNVPVQFETVSDGDELSARLEAGLVGFALLLVDCHLPRRSALEILSGSESQRPPIPVPIVVLSSFVADPERQQLLDLGASAVYAKPLDLNGYVSLAKELDSLMRPGNQTPLNV